MSSPKEIIHNEYCAGKCPKCDSDNIEYFGSEMYDEQLVYNSHCEDCNLDFHEYYDVKYDSSYGIEYIEEPEEETQLSCCGDEMTGTLEDVQICPTCKEHQ